MKTIAIVDLRTRSAQVSHDLTHGVRTALSYCGKPLAELVSLANRDAMSPLDSLAHAQEATAGRPDHPKVVAGYLRELAKDRSRWRKR